MRVSKGSARTQGRKRLKRQAKGYYGVRHRSRRSMKDAVMRTGRHSYGGRKIRKRDMRRLWIVRINAALTGRDLNYSRFLNGLKRAKVDLDRKSLSELAVRDPKAFEEVVKVAEAALKGA